jgi:hypothetical protein
MKNIYFLQIWEANISLGWRELWEQVKEKATTI